MIFLQLFWSFFQIGLFSIGGGYAALPLIQEQIVTQHGWMTMTEFSDIITISQMTPGPIAINAATFVGTRIAGPGGAAIATLGCVFPSCVIVLTLAFIYYKYRNITMVQGTLKGLQPAVVALIASAGLSILVMAFFPAGEVVWSAESVDFIAVGIFAVAFFVLRKWHLNPIWVMSGAGVMGVALYSLL